MGRKRKGDNALEERRKKTTLRKVERKHSGKITQPYSIMERLMSEVEHFAPLKAAKIIVVWKSGWKPTKDDILRHAQIRKLSELEREIWGDEYDLCMLLHRELWQSSKFSALQREMDVFHELCHVTPEIDDKTGDQKKDDRGRLCWRLRNHPIQRFPEEIARYGLDEVLNLDTTAKEAAGDDNSRAEAKATENDGDRPLLKVAEANLDVLPIESLQLHSKKVTDRQIQLLRDAGFDTVGKLVAQMRDQGEWWHRSVTGIGKDSKSPIEDAVAAIQAA
jgi:hypothetical protein